MICIRYNIYQTCSISGRVHGQWEPNRVQSNQVARQDRRHERSCHHYNHQQQQQQQQYYYQHQHCVGEILFCSRITININIIINIKIVQVKSYLTGKEPRERLRELVLEEHVECGCQCTPQVGNIITIITIIHMTFTIVTINVSARHRLSPD